MVTITEKLGNVVDDSKSEFKTDLEKVTVQVDTNIDNFKKIQQLKDS